MRDQEKTRKQLVAENEEAVRESEERYRTLAEASPDIIYILDRTGRLLYANRTAAAYMGLSPVSLAGKTQEDLFPPDKAQHHRERIQRVFETGEAGETEALYRFGSQDVWLNVRSIPLRDKQGQITSVMGICRNITELKRAEVALAEREERLLEAQEVASLGFYVLDIATGHWTSSPVLDRLFGIPVDYERTVEGWNDLVHPDERQAMLDYLLKEVVGKKKPFQREYRIVCYGDKQVRWVHGLGRLEFDKEGQPVSMLGTIQDITERKLAEEMLRQSEASLRRFYESGLLGVIYWNMNGQITDANDKFLEMVGYQRDDLLAGRLDWVNMTPPEYRHLDDRSLEELRATGVNKVPFEKEYLRKDGMRVPIIVAGAMLDEARFNGVAFVLDIAERKRAEKALQEAHDELERRVEERTTELRKANEQLQLEVEERRQAEMALRQSHDELRVIYDAMADGLLVTDIETLQFVRANVSICRMLGYSDTELRSLSVKDLHPTEALSHILENIRSPEEVKPTAPASLPVLRKDGNVFYAEVIGRFLTYDGRPCSMGIFRDITERMQAEAAIRQSHDELQAIYDQALDGILIADAEKLKVVRANLAYCRMIGYSEEDAYAVSLERLHSPEVLPVVWKHLDAIKKGNVSRIDNLQFLRKDGCIVYADVISGPICYNGRACCINFFHDVTDRKHAEDALERERQSLWRMLQASDHERQVISYEIHDGLAQYLAAAGMQFQAHDSLKQNSPKEAKKAYETAVELVRQAHFEARRLISEVRPPIIDEIGLETAISHLLHEQRRRGGPEIEYLSNVQFGRLPPILENALYRIIQEALSNACNHSKSKKVTVTMTQEGQDVRLEVRDWGIGFDPESVEKGHFGLEGIRQRVRLLGGRLTIESRPGSGTVVQVVVPILEKQNDG